MSIVGIKTTFWGPHAWAFLFSTIAGSYPIRIIKTNKEHLQIVKGFQQMFKSLIYTLPCIYCRQSFAVFMKEIPINNYENSRRMMMYWLYLIHDRVNKKLLNQEQTCFDSEKIKIDNQYKNGKITMSRYKKLINDLKTKIFKTKKSPTFESVLAKYEKERAGCKNKNKQCL